MRTWPEEFLIEYLFGVSIIPPSPASISSTFMISNRTCHDYLTNLLLEDKMFQVCQLVQTTRSAEVAGEIVIRGHFKPGSLKRRKGYQGHIWWRGGLYMYIAYISPCLPECVYGIAKSNNFTSVFPLSIQVRDLMFHFLDEASSSSSSPSPSSLTTSPPQQACP